MATYIANTLIMGTWKFRIRIVYWLNAKKTIPHQGLAEEELIDNFCCLIRDIHIFLNVLFTDMFIE